MSEKYEFIDAQYAAGATSRRVRADAPTLGQMCTWLSVSRSGFYEWRSRPMSATAARREELTVKIAALFELFDAVYGYRRIHAGLVRDGEQVSPELVRKLMRELELYPCQPRPYRTTTIRGREEPAGADLIGRDFGAGRPGTKRAPPPRRPPRPATPPPTSAEHHHGRSHRALTRPTSRSRWNPRQHELP